MSTLLARNGLNKVIVYESRNRSHQVHNFYKLTAERDPGIGVYGFTVWLYRMGNRTIPINAAESLPDGIEACHLYVFHLIRHVRGVKHSE